MMISSLPLNAVFDTIEAINVNKGCKNAGTENYFPVKLHHINSKFCGEAWQ